MYMPLISVIIPVYGVEKYIAQCLESVINQTYDNLEIIVVNDGTKDRSAEIAKEYAAKDNRIKVYDFDNGGASAARNRGIKLAKGEYIAFLDSDDWIEGQMYEKLVNEAIKSNADIVKCGFKSNKEKVGVLNKIERSGNQNIDLFFNGILWVVLWNAIYKADIVKKVIFPENVRCFEDNYASALYLFLSKKVSTIDSYEYNYRDNAVGISKKVDDKAFDRILVMNQLREKLYEYGYQDKRIDWKLAVEIYHFIRVPSKIYKTIYIDEKVYRFIKTKLDLRRITLFKYYCLKNKIKIK